MLLILFREQLLIFTVTLIEYSERKRLPYNVCEHHCLKNSWSQCRRSSSPVQSIVTCECHSHVVSV